MCFFHFGLGAFVGFATNAVRSRRQATCCCSSGPSRIAGEPLGKRSQHVTAYSLTLKPKLPLCIYIYTRYTLQLVLNLFIPF